MRSNLPSYQMISPASLHEGLTLLAHEPGVWQPFAGGTDLMVLLEAGKLAHKNYVNIWNLPELRGIEVSPEQVSIGSLTTYTEIQEHPVLREEFPMLFGIFLHYLCFAVSLNVRSLCPKIKN